jgi:hypothetical protein
MGNPHRFRLITQTLALLVGFSPRRSELWMVILSMGFWTNASL